MSVPMMSTCPQLQKPPCYLLFLNFKTARPHPPQLAWSFSVGSPSTLGFYSCGLRAPHPQIINMHPLKIQGNQHRMLEHGETACFLSHPPPAWERGRPPSHQGEMGRAWSLHHSPHVPRAHAVPWGLAVTPRPCLALNRPLVSGKRHLGASQCRAQLNI